MRYRSTRIFWENSLLDFSRGEFIIASKHSSYGVVGLELWIQETQSCSRESFAVNVSMARNSPMILLEQMGEKLRKPNVTIGRFWVP